MGKRGRWEEDGNTEEENQDLKIWGWGINQVVGNFILFIIMYFLHYHRFFLFLY